MIKIDFLRLLEKIRNPFFDFIFSAITHLGEETLFIVISLFIFWCVSKKYGYYILTVGFAGTEINQFLKLLFRIPRPWVLDSNFTVVGNAKSGAGGYSFPSGHTQNAVGTFGGISLCTDKKPLKYVCVALCILIPFSRMYLGVHTPLDVFVSVLIAALLIFTLKPLFEKTDENPKIMYYLFGVLILMAVLFILFVEFYRFPSDIDEANYQSGVKTAYMLFGALLGVVASYPIEKKHIRFETKAVWYVQAVKTVLGLLLVIGLKTVLKVPLNFICFNHPIAQSIRYFAIVFFSVAVWPLTFPFINRLLTKEKNAS